MKGITIVVDYETTNRKIQDYQNVSSRAVHTIFIVNIENICADYKNHTRKLDSDG